jgi:hypothetical protein
MKNIFNLRFLLFSLSPFFVSLTSFSQSPFDLGKNENVFFISREDLQILQIENIKEIVFLNELGGMNENTTISLIDFVENDNSVVQSLYYYFDEQKEPLTIEFLLENAQMLNETYWVFNNDTLFETGMRGYGTYCNWIYYYKNKKAYAIQTCENELESSIKKITYHQNLLPKSQMCCHSIDPSEIEENDFDIEKIILNDKNLMFTDTLNIDYDSDLKIKGFRFGKEKKTEPFLSTEKMEDSNVLHSQLYINNLIFEEYINQEFGFLPKFILVEIYKNAAFSFVYDHQKKRYYQSSIFELE